VRGKIENGEAARIGDGLGGRDFLLAESAANAERSFALSLIFRRSCDRTLRPVGVGGPFLPGWLLNPARPSCSKSRWFALFTRGRSIFLGRTVGNSEPAQQTASCRLPCL